MSETTTAIPADAVIEVTNAVCESLLGVMPIPCVAPLPAGERVTARVSISGAWRGAVEVRISRALAARLVREVLQAEPCSTDDPDVRDIVGELANMIGGNLKALLPEPCSLSLPSVANEGRPARVDLLQAFVLGEDAFEVAVAGAQ